MIARALDARVPCTWVLADEVYGSDRRLRMFPEQRETPIVLAVRGTETLWSVLDGSLDQHTAAVVLPMIRALVATRPTYDYRRITAVLNRQLHAYRRAPVNHKWVNRIMQANRRLLARKYTERPNHIQDGKVVVILSNLRWCSDRFEFTCWKSDIIRGSFIIDAHDREVIAAQTPTA